MSAKTDSKSGVEWDGKQTGNVVENRKRVDFKGEGDMSIEVRDPRYHPCEVEGAVEGLGRHRSAPEVEEID
nr:hypothetical protein CFP56_03261 [Quercus suber]